MRLIYIILFFFISCSIFAQDILSNLPTKKIYGQRADNCFKNNDFRKAAGYYLRAISNDTTDTQAILRLAETYNLLGDIKKSSDWYTKGIQISDKSIDYEYFLKYALVLNENENFDNAQYWFIVYQNKLYVDLQIGKYKHYTDKVEELFIDSTFHLIFNLKEINGKQSDINPILIQDRLLFSSQRTNSKTETLEGLVNIYKAHYSDTGTIGDVEKVTTTINTILNKGKMCYSVTSDELYFTGKITDKDQDSNQVDQGIFFTASPLAETSNSEITQISIPRFNNNIGHPALNKGNSRLYFTSNAPGGFGGMDLYYSEKINDKWQKPINLGETINSTGDETFPFLYKDSLLFFSSDGHGGLGGKDLFRTDLTKQNLVIENLGHPINSSSDDFSFFLKENSGLGFFFFFIKGGKGKDDLYSLNTFQIQILRTLLADITRENIKENDIKIKTGAGKDLIIKPDEHGLFTFKIQTGEHYKLIIEKNNYQEGKVNIGTKASLAILNDIKLDVKQIGKTELQLPGGKEYNIIIGNMGSKSMDLNALADSSGMLVTEDVLSKTIIIKKDDLVSLYFTAEKDTLISENNVAQTYIIADNNAIKLKQSEDIWFDYISESDNELNIIQTTKTQESVPVVPEEIAMTDNIETKDISDEEEIVAEVEEEILEKEIEKPESEIIPESDSLDIETPLSEESKMEPAHTVEDQAEDILAEITESEKPIDEALTDTKTEIIAQEEDSEEPEAEIILESDSLDIETPLSEETTIEPAHTVEDQTEDILAEITDSEKLKDDAVIDTKTDFIAQEEDSEEPEAEIILESDSLDIETPLSEETIIEPAHTVEDQAKDILAEITESEEPKDEAVISSKTSINDPEETAAIPDQGLSLKEKLITTSKQDIYYRLQVAAARKPIPEKELLRIYNGPNKLKMFKEDDYYKYYINDYPSYFEAKQTLNETDVKGVFIAAYANGKKVSLKEAMTTQYKERMLQNGKHISDSIINMVTVNFELDKFVLRKDEQEYLAKLVINPLKDKGSYYAIINGHTDIQGDNIYNLGLSEQRSEFVRQLIIDHGINPNRVSTLSFGESQVLKSCEIPEGCDDTVHRVNRRVEVILFSPKNP